ncbi:IS1634 family transposase [Sphingomonas sp. IW22]|uniref:IS1634 family transposase n=1 Tax=Sphingomonas sp. IW22 TaxID=3242489 RepID=UPI0035203AE3
MKEVIKEKLFDRRRDLFTDLSLVFMDTTSLSFYGAGGDTLGRRGHSKDHPPELAQMILAVAIDAQGRPICTEMVPGNTADVKVLVPIVKRLRTRFGITRSCVVADRSMISADTIATLEERGMEYILGARERSSSVIRDVVLNDTAPMVPLMLERQAGETLLWVKEVRVGTGKDTQRYIVTLNEAEAKSDKADRQGIIDGLWAQLKNARITPLQAVIRYRDLLQVEALFRVAKATFDTRPIYHQSDAAICGHGFVSFLALTLAKELTACVRKSACAPSGNRSSAISTASSKPRSKRMAKSLPPARTSQATWAASPRLSASPCRPISRSRQQPKRCRALARPTQPSQNVAVTLAKAHAGC